MSVNDLQTQIDELLELIEQQSQKAREQTEQIAALQTEQQNARQRAEQARSTSAATATLSTHPHPSPSATTTARFDASKIPDAIKMIVTYGGDTKTLSNWINSVESKLTFAKGLCPTATEENNALPLWYSIIRDKIIDKANDVLVQNHTPVVWADIKKTLEDHFGDKRDLGTLVTKIPYLQQNARSIDTFFNECRELLSDISAKISLDQEMKVCAKPLLSSYECMIRNAFVDGLNEPYATLTRASRPTNLNEAFQSATEQFNASQRRKERNFKPTGNSNGPPSNRPLSGNSSGSPFNRPYQSAPFFQHNRPQNTNFNYRPQWQGLPNIKPDPSGQNRQTIVPFRKPNQPISNINMHEAEMYPRNEEEEQDDNPTVQLPETEETQEELNFCMATDQSVTE